MAEKKEEKKQELKMVPVDVVEGLLYISAKKGASLSNPTDEALVHIAQELIKEV